MSNHFFIADEHYGHKNIIEFCHRPFSSVEEMTEILVSNHNAKVGKYDVTHHVGDVFWRTLTVKEAGIIMDRLNGKHILYWGNHDEVARQIAGRFEATYDVNLIKPRNQYPKIWLSHYAHRVWPDSHKGSWHVFGHTHAALPDYRRSHDVGVDANGFAPVSIDELADYIAKREASGLEFCPLQAGVDANTWNRTPEEREKSL